MTLISILIGITIIFFPYITQALPEPLTQADMNALEAFKNQGPEGLTNYYGLLQIKKYPYAELAKGVVLGNTSSGSVARKFAENVGKMTGLKPSISGEEWIQISKRLMEEDFSARQSLFSNGQSVVELPVKTIRDYHSKVFREFNLPPEAWTAYAPTVIGNPDTSLQEGIWNIFLESINSTAEEYLAAFSALIFTFRGIVFLEEGSPDEKLAALWLLAMFFGPDRNNPDGAIQKFFSGEADLQPYHIQTPGGAILGGTQEGETLISGAGLEDTLIGYGGNDSLFSNDKDDTLFGNGGNDLLQGGPGNDILVGGDDKFSESDDGTDTASYMSAASGIVVNLSGDDLQVSDDGDGGMDTLYSVENIIGSPFNDIITGNNTNNLFEGGMGVDEYRFSITESFINSDIGHDTIIDDDGLIVINDTELRGTAIFDVSLDAYSFQQGANTFFLRRVGPHLQIAVNDSGPSPANSITIQNFQNGTFGITLEEDMAAAGTLDLAFVIDITNSMTDDIAAVKASATRIVEELAAKTGDYRVAIVTYEDHTDPGPSSDTLLGFSSDAPGIVSAVQSISLNPGNVDIPEEVYSGLMQALTQLAWREEAARVIILMGDAPPHDPEPETGFTEADVIEAANGVTINPLPTLASVNLSQTTGTAASTTIHAILIDNDAAARASFTRLAEGTRGRLFEAATADEVVDAVLDVIDVIDPTPPPPPPSAADCTSLFGSAPGFLLCEETATSCSFNVATNGGTCTQICAGFGTACLGAVSNRGGCEGHPERGDTCDTPRPMDEICICEHPSGSTPPPPPPPPPAAADCTELFGSAPGFIFCEETATTCSFNVRTNGGTCTQICAGFGTACVGAISNAGSCEGNPARNDTCETPRPVDEICICERPETP